MLALDSRPAQFEGAGNTVAGQLTLPPGPGPHPAIVYIPGSGATTREGLGMLPAHWRALAEVGVASLAWDKPGVGESSGDFRAQTINDRAEEAQAAIRWLQRQPEIDSSRIGAWGISQAGWVMPRLYHLAPADVAYLVMVSTPVGTASEQEVYRVANQLAADGYSPDDVADAVGFTRVREWLRASAAEFSPYIDYLQSLVAEKPWAQELGQLDARAWDFSVRTLEETNVRTLLPGIKCPVLALFGDRDTIVDWRESKREYENVLPDVTIHVFPNTDHAMLQNATGSMKTMIASFEAPTDAKPFAPDYLPTLANWVSERVVSTRR